jgi:hypothetical protein
LNLTCSVDGKEVEFGKGWETPIELRNMRWEGGVDRADLAVTFPPAELAALSLTMSTILNLDETITHS